MHVQRRDFAYSAKNKNHQIRSCDETRQCVVCSGRSVKAARSPLQENRSGTDLHEHAEARLEQVGETAGHVLDVGTLRSVRVEDLLQHLPQEGTVGGLQDEKHHVSTQKQPHRVKNRDVCTEKRRKSSRWFFSVASARLRDGCGRERRRSYKPGARW